MDWNTFWTSRKTSSFKMTGFENWISEDEYRLKVKELVKILEIETSNTNVVHIGAGSGTLENLLNSNNWKSYDANPQCCFESNGKVNQRLINNPKEVLNKDSLMLMVSTSFYFREAYMYDAIKFCNKTILVDVPLKEDSLSLSTVGESHSVLSIKNILLLGKSVKILPFSFVPFRKTLIIEDYV